MKWSRNDVIAIAVIAFVTLMSSGCVTIGRMLIVQSLSIADITEGNIGLVLLTIGCAGLGGMALLVILFVQYLVRLMNPVVVTNVAAVLNRVASETEMGKSMTLLQLEAAVRRAARAQVSGDGDA